MVSSHPAFVTVEHKPAAVFQLAPTTVQVAQAAHQLSLEHDFQIWAAVIWSAARQAGAGVLFTEDPQDGFNLDGMTIVNPFALTDTAFTALIADR
jgi:predicted nucleic acid-binding protein